MSRDFRGPVRVSSTALSSRNGSRGWRSGPHFGQDPCECCVPALLDRRVDGWIIVPVATRLK